MAQLGIRLDLNADLLLRVASSADGRPRASVPGPDGDRIRDYALDPVLQRGTGELSGFLDSVEFEIIRSMMTGKWRVETSILSDPTDIQKISVTTVTASM